MLEREGLEVLYEPPQEDRGIGGDTVVGVIIYVGNKVADATIGRSVDTAIDKAVTKFRERFPQARAIQVRRDARSHAKSDDDGGD
jgi:hypothetical protein